MGPGFGMGWGAGMGWMWLWWLLVLVGLIVLVVVLARTVGGSSGGRTSDAGTAPRESSARRILDERFARGEIDEAEYRARRHELNGD